MIKSQLNKLSNRFEFPTWPSYADDEIAKATEPLLQGKTNYWTGQEGKLFEAEYAKSLGMKYAVAVMNGTVALEAALIALDIGEGDEVITTSRTFIASASCIIMRGARPIFADVDLVTQNITAETIEPHITARTKAIIVVHLAGWPCEMDTIVAMAKKYNLYVIEDCAQAHGARYQGQPVGSWGDIAAFSFCQDKIISTGGEGGIVVTNNKTWWEKIWAFKDHGKSYNTVMQKHPPGFRFLHESFGTNWRMTEMQAAIGRAQLAKLPNWLKIRRQNAALLNDQFQHIPGFRLTVPPLDVEHAYYKYYIFIEPENLKSDWDRDTILQAINKVGVPCFSGSCSEIYLEKAFTERHLAPEKRLVHAKLLGETSLMFLVHPGLTRIHMLYTADIVRDVMRKAIR
ncbi:MAG: DegT/DnrJ/EryC1/StrS aminotransferase family protein [Gammaproteobacteria bacterium]|nr:DegT/DnrJ/EryC1/StrS aminotransferase family protein [Gammaproteobacteria bacterium]